MKNLLFICLIVFSQVLFSQTKTKLIIKESNSLNNIILKSKSFKDSISINNYLENKLSKLISHGYISASIDSVSYGDTSIAYLHKGEKYIWGKVEFSKEFELIDNKQINKSTKQNNNLNVQDIETKIEKTINYFENNGYPFCKIKLENVSYTNTVVDCKINVIKNKKIKIDSIIVKGNAKISVKYLEKYLEIKTSDLYNEKKISDITKKINNLSFISSIKESDILFYEDKVKIILYIEKKQASRFDGILGVVPRDKTSGRLLLTGELNLMLKNSFAHAETIGLSLEKTDNETQKINLLFNYPYIFNTILGIGTNFNLLKQDTSFLNLKFRAMLNFILPNNNSLDLFVENKSTTLLSVEQFVNSTVLPPYADTKISLIGLGINSRNTDRYYLPMRGYIFYIESSVGEKNIYKNNKIPDELYKDLDLNSLQIESILSFKAFIKLQKRVSLDFSTVTKYIENSNLFANELFRFGGLSSIRGFKEDELYADFVSMGTFQLNYFYEQYSSFYIFSDFAYYENHINEFVHDTPIGIGIGANFSSKAGVFTVSYAVGKQFNNAFNLQTARIHFGYLAQF